MTYYNHKIPEKNGEFICIPSLNLIPQLIKSNKEKFKAYNFTIGDEDFHNLRDKIRKKVIQLSEEFTANLGIRSHLYNNADTIVQTGHQPIFYHPGIIIKNLILNKIGMMEGINAINLIVDTDNFEEIAVNIPDYRDCIKIDEEVLLSNQHPIPYEFSAPPLQEAFNLFIESIKNHLSHPQFKNLHDNFNRYINKMSDVQNNFKTLSEFMTVIRRIYEDEIESKYLEIPLSYICNTDEFLLFFLSIAMESEKFTSIYNCHLERYRKEHKLRYPVNPFPDLKADGKKIELPFWYFHNNKRDEIFVECNIEMVNIYFGRENEIRLKRTEIDKGIKILKKGNIKIRPKAIILTLFNRMFVSDAFIHGVGGAKYDRITDNIIRDFYNVEPPDFVTASLTLYPDIIKGQDKQPPQSPLTKGELKGVVPFIKEELQENIKKLEKKLRDMRYNPERYSKDNVLLREKENLVSLMEIASASPRNDICEFCHSDPESSSREESRFTKKEISIKLKEINERIYQKIKPAVEGVESEMKILKKKQEELEVIQRRDYPYFLFSSNDIIKIIDSISQRGK